MKKIWNYLLERSSFNKASYLFWMIIGLGHIFDNYYYNIIIAISTILLCVPSVWTYYFEKTTKNK